MRIYKDIVTNTCLSRMGLSICLSVHLCFSFTHTMYLWVLCNVHVPWTFCFGYTGRWVLLGTNDLREVRPAQEFSELENAVRYCINFLGLNMTNIFSYNSGDQKSEIKGSADSHSLQSLQGESFLVPCVLCWLAALLDFWLPLVSASVVIQQQHAWNELAADFVSTLGTACFWQ